MRSNRADCYTDLETDDDQFPHEDRYPSVTLCLKYK